MGRKKWSDENFVRAVADNVSRAGVMRDIGLAVGSGTSYRAVNAGVLRLGLDTSHWTGQGHLRGKSHGWARRMSNEEILVENSTYLHTSSLKKRLLKDGLLENVCQVCRMLPEWQGKPLTLRLDHVNGIGSDNRIENLRLVCPNCDSQLPTFTGRNIGNKNKPS